MEELKITDMGDVIGVTSPYHPWWAFHARQLGGRWRSPAWVFPRAALDRVRAKLLSVYGECGDPVERVAIVARWPAAAMQDSDLWAAGRCIVRRRTRDAPVQPGAGVIILEGEFPPRGGSAKNPKLAAEGPLTARIVGVPRHVVDDWINFASGAELLEVVEQRPPDVQALERAMAQLALQLPPEHPMRTALERIGALAERSG